MTTLADDIAAERAGYDTAIAAFDGVNSGYATAMSSLAQGLDRANGTAQSISATLRAQAALCGLAVPPTLPRDLYAAVDDIGALATLLYPSWLHSGMMVRVIASASAPNAVIALPPGTFIPGTTAADLHTCGGIVGYSKTATLLKGITSVLHGTYVDHSNFVWANLDLDMTGAAVGTDGHTGAGFKVYPADPSHPLTGLRFLNCCVHDVINGGSAYQINGADGCLLQDCSAYNIWATGAWAVHVHSIYPDMCNWMSVLRFYQYGRISGAFFKPAVSSGVIRDSVITCDPATIVPADDLGFWLYDGDTSAFNGTLGQCSAEVYNTTMSNAANGAITVRAACSLIAQFNTFNTPPVALIKQHGYTGSVNPDFATANTFGAGVNPIKVK